MRRRGLLLAALALVLFGCERAERGSDEPMPTDGPDQVVLKVPAMSCLTCPASVGEALISLSWVDSDTLKIDAARRQARFKVKDREQFNMDEVKRALGKRYSYGVKLLAGPTSQ